MPVPADAASIDLTGRPDRMGEESVREPSGCRALSFSLLLLMVVYLVSKNATLIEELRNEWKSLLVWGVLVVIVNLFPIWLGDITFTLDMPLLLALALLYPPEVATFIALVGSVDVRELTGRVAPSRAIFNRAQVALGVLAAAWVFRMTSSGLEPWTVAVFATLLATGISYAVNVFLVATYTHLRQRVPLWSVVQSLTRGRLLEFAATYAGYCGLAIVLAYLFRDVGGWSVVLFLIPTIVAQQMLVRGQRLQAATEQLVTRERLLERSFDRVVDERRDERVRIAGELHDEVLGTISDILLQARRAGKDSDDGAPINAELEQLVASAERSVSALRAIIRDLQKSPLGRGGLIATLGGLVRDLQLDWGTRIHFAPKVEAPLQPETQVLAYQVAREALVNALKHSAASEIWVTLGEDDEGLVIEVSDNGSGFEDRDVDSSLHFGVGLMKERVRVAGGSLSLESSIGKGTLVRARLPLEYRTPREDWIERARGMVPAGLMDDTEQPQPPSPPGVKGD